MVLAQTSLPIEPREGSLHHPAPGFKLEALALTLADMNLALPLLFHAIDKRAPVSLAGTQRLHAGKLRQDDVGKHAAFHGVCSVGGMHMHGPEVALGVHGRLAAAAPDLFASVEAARLAFMAGLDTLRID